MSLVAKVKLAASMAEIGAHSVWDRVVKPRPDDARAIPPSDEAITREWLSSALCGRLGDAEVVDFTFGGSDQGTTSRRKIVVTYNEAGNKAGLSTRIFAKTTAQFTSRLTVGITGAGVNEAEFYNRVRGDLDLEAPVAFYANADGRSGRSMFLFEDMAEVQGCTFLGPSHHIDRENAEGMVELLAALHATYWNSPKLNRFSWLQTSQEFQAGLNDKISFEGRSVIGIDRAQAVIPQALLDRKEDVFPATMRSLELNVRGPQTFLHHDVHVGNWYMTKDGRMGLGDWQCTVIGNWACDIAYVLSCGLDVEDRRAWEEDLVRLYLERLGAAGVDAPSFDDAWLAYRRQMFHGLLFWVYTIGAGSRQPNMQPDEISLVNIERMTNAVVDLDSFAAVNGG